MHLLHSTSMPFSMTLYLAVPPDRCWFSNAPSLLVLHLLLRQNEVLGKDDIAKGSNAVKCKSMLSRDSVMFAGSAVC